MERTDLAASLSLLEPPRVAGALRRPLRWGVDPGVRLTVDEPRLWWPRGYGGQPLYDLDVTLSDEGGRLDAWHRRIGFRTIELDRAPDARGSGFTLVVNGERVFARGVNWIPDDVFPSPGCPPRATAPD
ncbi:beta-mannosidase [Streptomyces badius]